MKKCDVDYTLYLCTDRDLMSTDTLEEAVTRTMEPEDRAVYRAVLELPKAYRTAIHLHYYEGYSVAEIAALTGAKEGTVKSWLSRGREKLAQALKGEELP